MFKLSTANEAAFVTPGATRSLMGVWPPTSIASGIQHRDSNTHNERRNDTAIVETVELIQVQTDMRGSYDIDTDIGTQHIFIMSHHLERDLEIKVFLGKCRYRKKLKSISP